MITINKKEFQKAIIDCNKAIEKDNIYPEWNCVWLRFKFKRQSELFIQGHSSNQDIVCLISYEGKIDQDYQYLIDPKVLISLFKNIQTDYINIHFEKEHMFTMLVDNIDGRYDLGSIGGSLPEVITDSKKEIKLDPLFTTQLKQVFQKALNFCEKDSELFGIENSIHLVIDESMIMVEATNKYRIYHYKYFYLENEVYTQDPVDVSIDYNFIERYLEHEELRLFVDNKKSYAMNKNYLISTNLINVNYPDTSKIITDDFEVEFKVNMSELNDAVKQVKTIASWKKDKEGSYIMLESLNNNTLRVSSICDKKVCAYKDIEAEINDDILIYLQTINLEPFIKFYSGYGNIKIHKSRLLINNEDAKTLLMGAYIDSDTLNKEIYK